MNDKERKDGDIFFNSFQELQREIDKKPPSAPPSLASKQLPAALKRPASAQRDADDATLFLQTVSNPGFKPMKNVAPPEKLTKRPPKPMRPDASPETPDTKNMAPSLAKIEPLAPPAAPVNNDELDLLASAMQGVKPMDGKGRELNPPRPEPKINMLENPDCLQYFLQGKVEFALEYTDEFFEGHVMGLDPLVLAKLRSGQYSPESHIDLHGQNAEQALESLTMFIRHAYIKGQRSLVVVTGRGKNSPGGLSILRQHMQDWLTRDPLKRVVLAFCTAQPKDGGAGAIYVLLRKYKKTGKIRWDRRNWTLPDS